MKFDDWYATQNKEHVDEISARIAWNAGVIIEREACAKACEAGADPSPFDIWGRAHNNACRTRAIAIRERSNAK